MGIGVNLTGFHRHVVVSTAMVVGKDWEQGPAAAYWIRGVPPAQIITPTAMMLRPLGVYSPITTDLNECYSGSSH